MSAVPLKVILMGFNLLLGARGNILMRESRRAPTSNSVIAPTDAILLRPHRGIKVLRCHLQHCPSSPASPDWWPGQKPQYVHTHTHKGTHSLPYFKSTSRTIRCLLEATVYSLLTYGWRSMATAAPTERMNIKASAQQCGGARAKGSVCFVLCPRWSMLAPDFA